MSRYAALIDEAGEVRLVAGGTDLRLSLAGRNGEVDAGGANIPAGRTSASSTGTSSRTCATAAGSNSTERSFRKPVFGCLEPSGRDSRFCYH
jgi:hypothetical protein